MPAHGSAVAAQIGERFKGAVQSVRSEGRRRSSASRWAGRSWSSAPGPAGVELVSREAWTGQSGLRAIADVNAVPPLGVEGVEMTDNDTEREGVRAFGAMGIGGLKMKAHKAAVARLFEQNDAVLDAEEVYDLAAAL